LDRAFNIVTRHVGLFGGQDRCAQPWVAIGIASANAGRNRYFLDNFGEDFPFLYILNGLDVLHLTPF
jgi:hypothetical protein